MELTIFLAIIEGVISYAGGDRAEIYKPGGYYD